MPTISCPQCGAINPVPATGLEMTCEYCKLTRPVPDAAARRRATKKDARRERVQEERAAAAARPRPQEPDRQPRGSGAWLLKSVFTLAILGVTGYMLYHNGLFDWAVGDPGRGPFEISAKRLEGAGYRAAGAPAVEGTFSAPVKLYLKMTKGTCYALAVGSGQLITRVRLHARRRVVRRPERLHTTITHCPPATTVLRADVKLRGPGRLTWSLLSRPGKAAPAPRVKSVRRKKRRARKRKRSSRKRPSTGVPSSKKAPAPPRDPAAPAPAHKPAFPSGGAIPDLPDEITDDDL